ncbi:DUF1493 family protein [Burkholderia glumae]|uniref:DUF1493 family protein n=1 Tax=Burkholderia glumae TaxID=337 RepID=UPI001373E308|nr:DUF1493 family protein [Burkholderia glumae]MCR1767872.1 DUF1493 family protein [Burkholderia glumae]QHP90383.1 DUF1493 family protein [Burkholderia glumae]QKM47706.1 hypothetical protein B7760_01729 [Burkholderia glumae]UVS96459.1 DUF1493 family protein [Burkholderia glumae]
MRDDIWQRLEEFTREELGRPLLGGSLNIKPESRLEQDLGLTGLDAVEFIDEWAERFNVDAKDFPYRRYFGPEGQELLSSIIGLFSRARRRPERVPLTMGMLAEATRRGRWSTEEIEAAAGRDN